MHTCMHARKHTHVHTHTHTHTHTHLKGCSRKIEKVSDYKACDRMNMEESRCRDSRPIITHNIVTFLQRNYRVCLCVFCMIN